MKKLFEEIIKLEWAMFSATQNIGGQASCQQDPVGFEIMRYSQFSGWDKESMELYLGDLEAAAAEGRNLVTMKYAYMMESTDPVAYRELEAKLPKVEGEKRTLVESLTAQTVCWCREFAERYPHVAAAGRPIDKSADNIFTTSVETYSRGEFSSYGEETLRSLLRHYKAMAAAGENLHEKVVAEEMRLMGIESLQRAEELLSHR